LFANHKCELFSLQLCLNESVDKVLYNSWLEEVGDLIFLGNLSGTCDDHDHLSEEATDCANTIKL
jgi:hypothetical protein